VAAVLADPPDRRDAVRGVYSERARRAGLRTPVRGSRRRSPDRLFGARRLAGRGCGFARDLASRVPQLAGGPRMGRAHRCAARAGRVPVRVCARPRGTEPRDRIAERARAAGRARQRVPVRANAGRLAARHEARRPGAGGRRLALRQRGRVRRDVRGDRRTEPADVRPGRARGSSRRAAPPARHAPRGGSARRCRYGSAGPFQQFRCRIRARNRSAAACPNRPCPDRCRARSS